MASNSISLYSSNYPSSSPYTLTASIVENSYSVTNNTSNVTITATIASGGVHYSGYSTPTMSIQYKDNNTQAEYVSKASEQISSVTSSNPSRTVSWTGDVVHKDDGTLTATVKAVWSYKTSGTGYAPKSGEVEVTLTMTTIPRAGGVSISPASGTISTSNGANIFTATVTPQSTSFYHRISATCNNTSVMTAVWAEDSSNKGYITDTSLLTALGNNTSGTVTVTVQTYATKSTSGTLIGTKTATASVSVNTSAIKPSLTSVSIAIKTTPISGYLVAGYSTANVKFTVAAGSGSTSCTTTVTLSRGTMATASASGTGAKTLATNAMDSSTDDYTLTATITARDGRGATATATATYTVKGYTQPAVSITAYRVDANGSTTADEAGPYAYIAYAATAKSIGNNSIQSMTATYSGSVSGTLSASPSWVALTESQGITITVTATDRVTSTTLNAFVSVATFPLDLYQDGDDIRMGIAKVPELAGFIDSALNMRVVHDTALSRIQAVNSLATVDLQVAASGNSGIWSPTHQHWLVYDGTDGHTRMMEQYRAYTDTSATPYTLTAANSGQLIRMLNSGAKTITVPSGFDVGYFVDVISVYANSVITFNFSDGEGLYVPNGSTLSTVTMPYGLTAIRLIKVGSSRWSMFNNTPTYYTTGDVLTTGDVQFGNGFVTTSQTELTFDLPLPKPILGATTATVTTLTGNMRSSLGGYVAYYDGTTRTQLYQNNWVDYCDSMTATVLRGHIRIRLNCTNKWQLGTAAITNNTLVNAYLSTLSITLS